MYTYDVYIDAIFIHIQHENTGTLHTLRCCGRIFFIESLLLLLRGPFFWCVSYVIGINVHLCIYASLLSLYRSLI